MSNKRTVYCHLLPCLLAVCVLLATSLCGCKKDDDERSSGRRGRKRDVNALRGMPYAGGTVAAPEEETGVVLREPESCPGFNLYTVQKLCQADLIDADGNVINSWGVPSGEVWEHSELLPNGDLLVIGADKHEWEEDSPQLRIADSARYLLRFNWAGELLWKRSLMSHHDIEMTPAGNLLMLSLKRRRLPRINPDVDVCDTHITMLNGDGQVLESHSILDAVERSPELFPLDPVQPDTLGGEPWVDLFHANSLQWIRCESMRDKHPIYQPGNTLVCFRHQNRIAVLNWAENRVVWTWGHDQLDGPHDAQVLDNGHIILFDNGLVRGFSRVLEIDPIGGKVVWQYKAESLKQFYTPTKGSAQRLPNGNTLIAESDRARAFEVTPDGEKVWYFKCPHSFESEGGEEWLLNTQTNTFEKVSSDQIRFRRATIVRLKRFPPELIEAIQRTQTTPTAGTPTGTPGTGSP